MNEDMIEIDVHLKVLAIFSIIPVSRFDKGQRHRHGNACSDVREYS